MARNARFVLCLSSVAFIALLVSARDVVAMPPFGAPYLAIDVASHPAAVVSGDFNEDGYADLAVPIDRILGSYSTVVSIYLGHGDGTFGAPHDVEVGVGPCQIAVGDLNGDRHLDLVVRSGFEPTHLSVLLGHGDGTFGSPTDVASGGFSPLLGDLDGDGRLDLVFWSRSPDQVSVLLGNGDGTFGTRVDHDLPKSAVGIAIGDLNRDGRLDLAVALDDTNTVAVLLGNGDGSFETGNGILAGPELEAVAISDLDRDGNPDVVALGGGCATNGAIWVALSNGDGTFRASQPFAAGHCYQTLAIRDMNLDGKPDVVTADRATEAIAVVLGNGDGTLGMPREFLDGGLPVSVAIDDLTGDGAPDVVVANYDVWISLPPGGFVEEYSLRALLGNGDGTLGGGAAYPVGGTASLSSADLNDDGVPDLAAAGGGVSVLLGRATGGFDPRVDYATGEGASAVAIGDVNGDGWPDLVALETWNSAVEVLLGAGNGAFSASTHFSVGPNPYGLAAGLINSDPRLDLAIGNSDNTVSLLPGNGDGTFGAMSGFTTQSGSDALAMADLDGDGKPDLAVANRNSAVQIWLANGDGTFRLKGEYQAGDLPNSIAIGDLNGDGRPDLVVGNGFGLYVANTVAVLLGNGDGSFGAKREFVTGFNTVSIAIGDLNGDGRPDLAVVNRGPLAPPADGGAVVSVLLGDGTGRFGSKTDYGVGADPTGVVIGDFTADGAPDLAVTEAGAGVAWVLVNTSGSTSSVAPTPSVPAAFRLEPPRPNPTQGPVEIRFVLPSAYVIEAAVFDLAGRKVSALSTAGLGTPGEHSLRWDGRDRAGVRVGAGMYLVQLRAGHQSAVRKLLVLR